MSALVRPLWSALDATPAPVPFFLRDDDAGWDDARLFALLDATLLAQVPIDLAVIPMAAHAGLAAALVARKQDAPHLLGVHQHGLAHTNHETTARKCEFGESRSADQQGDDLIAGRARLLDAFGSHLDDFFTPPWNRCSARTPSLLAALGFTHLSRDRSAPAQTDLPERSIDVDWCKLQRAAHERGDADGGARIVDALTQRVTAGGPVGLMLHHAAMDAADLALLVELLHATSSHPQARWTAMRNLPIECGAPLHRDAHAPGAKEPM